jgi:IclR family acetate operon transcriptional repressor
MQQNNGAERGALIQSVQRAAILLKAFATGPAELGVNELSRTVGLHKSTVSRMLATLEREGLVERVPTSEKYQLGFEIVRLAGQVPHFGDLRAAASPYLKDLAEWTRETVNLGILDENAVVYVEQLSGQHLVRHTNWVGQRTPLHCTASGKAVLAFQPPTAIEAMLSEPLPQFTNRTITAPDKLYDELATVRRLGYAVTISELEEGLNAVAAPITDASRTVVAAVSVSGPAYRLSAERLSELAVLTVATAGKIAARLGSARA